MPDSFDSALFPRAEKASTPNERVKAYHQSLWFHKKFGKKSWA